jgi:hypothetical protein
MFLKPLKDRLSFTLIVVGVGLVTALIMGNGLLAAIVAIAAVLSIGVVSARRAGGRSLDATDRPRRLRGEPFSFRSTWMINHKPNLEQVVQALTYQGLTSSSRSDLQGERVVVVGGSQLRTRLLGGYFVAPKHLPVRAELVIIDAGNRGQHKLELQVRDTIGLAARDRALEARYVRAATNIREVVEHSLNLPKGSADAG